MCRSTPNKHYANAYAHHRGPYQSSTDAATAVALGHRRGGLDQAPYRLAPCYSRSHPLAPLTGNMANIATY
ncbi:hypothetical protein XFF6166_880010 [Xanthomonas citri pv. fuscans]|nr:hypothetical protein XFF6166_880010 [Xanthomonas citri pv. fuscans]SOO04364.1 hypothetical protein XFF6960_970010 [Xanthomonas citri pv. fuscans]SOO07511.1 hypothetical protein XFF7767_970087 [Xanthomonas citri pv. fuscans]SOO08061.1 hypothetical protein XFF6970_150004 [Xanthomonas citri pv. fuscans]SOO13431.1 hypothetical protein XFF7766_180004 [Xanthomonas citri pv. fuscans]